MKHLRLLIFVILFPAAMTFSAGPLQERLNALMVYGDGFIFGVQEPENWTGDTGNATSFHVNIIFYPKGQAWNSQGAVIRVRINKKVDERTEEDLAHDMAGYRNKFPKIQFADIDATHSKYRCFPKVFFVEGDFYEYVTYVNPGGAQQTGRARDDQAYSRRYSYWSKFAQGSLVSYRCSRKTAQGLEESLLTFTLKDVTPEFVHLECSSSNIPSADPSAASAAGLIQLEFREADDEFQGWDLFGVRLGYNFFHALRNPAAKVVEETRENLLIMGTSLPTTKKSIRFGKSDSTTTLTVWLSEDIPGKIVKYVREFQGTMDVREEASAAEYRTIRAEPSEVERLRASRKPSPLDIPAWDYVTVRLGLVDEYHVAFREFTEARNSIRTAVLENIQANPASLKKILRPARNKLKELADRLNQDTRSVEEEIGPAEFVKLRPITRVGASYASFLVKEARIKFIR